jgi:Flp pilus assembly protein TadG
MMMRSRRKRVQAGQVIVLVVLALAVLVGAAGLALDVGMAYLVRAKLNAALDAAALAAARAVSQGATEDEQRASAVRAAHDFFDANYPSGYLGASVQLADPVLGFDGGKVLVDAAATARLPARLLRVLDIDTIAIAASAQALRKDLDMAIVIDTTGSMNTGDVPAQVRSNTKLFVSKFNRTLDRLALIQYAYGAVVAEPFAPRARGFDIASFNRTIDAFSFAGSTNSSEGLWQARDQLNNTIEPAARSSMRVIVFFSDGAPNSFASRFTFNSGAACAAAGTISTTDLLSADWPTGLRRADRISATEDGACWQNGALANPDAPVHISRLGDWYDAHNPGDDPALREFPIVVGSPRVVTSATGTKDQAWRNVNRAARNLLEAMAAKARQEGIYVFTLGLGNQLTLPAGPDGERGEDILKCMANVADAPERCAQVGAGQRVGTYCHAADENELKPCFDKLASAILRITK